MAMVIMCQTWSLIQWWPHIGRGWPILMLTKGGPSVVGVN